MTGVGMPGQRFSSDPSFSFAIDKWPNPTKCTWFLSGVSKKTLECSTPKCGFKCEQPHKLLEHEEKCTNEVSIKARNITYG